MSRPLMERRIARKTRAGAPVPGFAGRGHTAVEVVGARALGETNPFVLLMDDTLDFAPGQPVGEAHPHAGLETVTLMLEGSLDDRAEGLLEEGDVAWMTAARGLIHNEQVTATGRARILQLWIALDRLGRDGDPDLQIIRRNEAPVRREVGVEAYVYSGRSGGVVSSTRNRVPATVVDFRLQPEVSVVQELPGAFTTFIYLIEGGIEIGGETLSVGDVGWLDWSSTPETVARLKAGPWGARAILYAGERVSGPIVQRGPFVAGSTDELTDQYRAFRAGLFLRISDLTGH